MSTCPSKLTGQPGYGGDGGPASEAMLQVPRGLAADAAGNVYVAEWGNRRVRRIDAVSGIIETVLEADGCSPLRVTVDGDGNVYVGGRRRIRMINADWQAVLIAGTGTDGFSGDGAPAGSAELSVYGIAVDRFGAVWFTDPISRRIRVLEPWPAQN